MISPTLSLLIALVATVASAQFTPVRISGVEDTTLALPLAMRMQSALTIDDTTVVVWGSFDLDRHGIAQPSLRMQLSSHGTSLADSRVLHSDSARPSGVVHVTARQPGFVVLWNDTRRFNPGLYARGFDRQGIPFGDEVKLIAGRIIDVVSYDGLPGVVTVIPLNGRPVILRDGFELERQSIDSARFARPHVMRIDSSLVSLNGSRLDFWKHYRDPLPERTIELSVPDSAFSQAWSITAGNAGSTVATVLRHDPSHRWCAEFSDGLRIRQISLDPNLNVIQEIDVDSVLGCGSTLTEVTVFNAVRSRLDGGYRVDVTFARDFSAPGQVATITYVEQPIAITACGMITHGVRHRTTCRPGTQSSIRLTQDTISSVAVGDQIFPSAIAAIQKGVDDRTPNVVLFRESRLVTMARTWPVDFLRSTVDARIAQWSIGGITFLKSVWRSHGIQNSIDNQHTRSSTISTMNVQQIAGLASLVYVSNMTVQGPISGTIFFGSWLFMTATDTGWVQAGFVSDERDLRVQSPLVGHDPNMHRATYSIVRNSSVRRAVVVDSSGTVISDTSLIPFMAHAIIPIAPGSWAAPNDTALMMITAGGIGATSPIPIRMAREGIWCRMLGPIIARAETDANDGALTLERYGLDLQFVDSVRVPLPIDAEHLWMCQNERDSSLVLLYATKSGIRIIHFVSDLTVRSYNKLVFETADSVAHPSAMFVNNELHVVWEDFRNGDGDVYGRVVPAPFSDAPSTPSPSSRARSISAYPTPSSEYVHVDIGSQSDPGMLIITDALGTTRYHRFVERHARQRSITLDVSQLPPGVYWASLRGRDHFESCRIVISR